MSLPEPNWFFRLIILDRLKTDVSEVIVPGNDWFYIVISQLRMPCLKVSWDSVNHQQAMVHWVK